METLKIETGNLYRTRSGHKVRIYATDAGVDYTVHGATYWYDGTWGINTWKSNGCYSIGKESRLDIISEWEQTIDDIGFDKSCLPMWAKFICMNENGRWYWFKTKPVFSVATLGNWHVYDECLFGIIPAEHAPKNYQGDWKDSLFEIE